MEKKIIFHKIHYLKVGFIKEGQIHAIVDDINRLNLDGDEQHQIVSILDNSVITTCERVIEKNENSSHDEYEKGREEDILDG